MPWNAYSIAILRVQGVQAMQVARVKAQILGLNLD